MGNNQPNYVSSAKDSLISHDINNVSNKEAIELSKKMQHANFVIGDERNRQLKDAQSSYKNTISNVQNEKLQQNS
jgi:uncharacterized protein YjiK